jgi:HNH endonuclease
MEIRVHRIAEHTTLGITVLRTHITFLIFNHALILRFTNYIGKRTKMTGPNPNIVGDNNPCWRGGRVIDRNGYVHIYNPSHPYAKGSRKNYVREHVLVMEARLGRYLLDNEEVHHINGIRSDNRIENLELHTKKTHSGLEMKKRWENGRMRRVNFNHKRDPKTGRFI